MLTGRLLVTLSVIRLWFPAEGSTVPRHLGYERRDATKLEARRIAAMVRLKRGESTTAIARSLGVSISSVQRWARCYRLHGNEGLRRIPKSGPNPKLGRDKLMQLPGLLARGPIAYGFDTPVWTSERVALLIWQRFRVHYSFEHAKYLLSSIGWRWHEHTWVPARPKNFRSKTSGGEHAVFPTVR
jgi:transposase